MTLPELHAVLDRLGVELTARGDKLHYKAKSGSLTPEIKASLAAHKRALLALLVRADDGTDPAGPPASEPPEPVGSDGPGPPPADRGWRGQIARWPIPWRERWGYRANELQDRGEPWDAAEWIAYGELVPEVADAERRGEVVCADPPSGLSDAEAVAAIDRAFADPVPYGRSDRGPRGVRHGDRWLPWHEAEPAELRAKKRGEPVRQSPS
jgi:hypothetical protein